MALWMADTENLWTIYAIGAPNFMHKVFSAIAMLGEGGTLMRMGQIGFTVGLFVLVYRIATAVGTLSDVRQVFIAGVIFAAMFGTTTTVKLVGLVPTQGSGSAADIRVVDNVPWGIAAVGAVISGTGVYVTRRMETAFRDPNAIPVTQGGFGRTAEILASVRSLSQDSIPNSLPVFDHYKRSMLSYLRDCAMRARQFEVLSDHTIAHAPEPLSAIRWNNNLQQTRSWLVSLSGESEPVGCAQAHDLLQGKSGDMLAGLDPAYQERFGAGTSESIGRALASVAERSAQDAQTYMAGALINALWLEASSGSSFGSMGNSNTITLRAALEQRRTQWVSEETAFLKAMRPMIGYFEAFFYALSPFIAFLVGLGAMGLRMIVKYVSLTLAVALWMPILAITNLYQVSTLQDFFATQERMAQLADSGIFSLSNNAAVIDQATEAVALASMIAAATPMLTLTLLFGGAVAATSLFSRLQGQDHLNEKIATPDPVGAAPVYQSSPSYVGNDTVGLRRTGAEANSVRFDLGEQLQQSARVAEAQSRTATTSAMQTWGEVLSRNAAFEQVFANALEHQLTDATALSQNEGAQALERSGVDAQERLHAAESYAQSTAMKGDATAMAGLSVGRLLSSAQGGVESLQRNLSGVLPSGSAGIGEGSSAKGSPAASATTTPRSGGARLADLGAQASVSGEVRETGQDSTRMEKGLTDSRSLSTQQQKSVEMMMQHALSEAMRSSLQQAARFGISEQSSRQLARSASDLAQASQAFEEADVAAQHFDVGQSISLLAASERIRNLPPEQRQDIERLARGLGGDAAFSRNLRALRSGEVSGAPASPEGQNAAAALYTLAGIGPGVALTEHSPGLAGLTNERREALTYALGASPGLGLEALRSHAQRSETLSSDMPVLGATQEAVSAGMADTRFVDANEVREATQGQKETVVNQSADHEDQRSALGSDFVSSRDSLVAGQSAHIRQERQEMGESVVDRMQDMNNDGMHMVMQVQQQFAATEILPKLAGDKIREALDVQSDFGDDLRAYRQEAERHHVYGEEALAYAAAKYTVEHPLSEHTPVAGSYLKGYLDTALAEDKIDGQRAAVLFAKLMTAGELQQADYAELSVISGGMLAK